MTRLLQVDATRQAQWQKLTKLSPADMEALLNLEALGVPLQPKPKLGLTLTRRRNRAYRKVGGFNRRSPMSQQQAARLPAMVMQPRIRALGRTTLGTTPDMRRCHSSDSRMLCAHLWHAAAEIAGA